MAALQPLKALVRRTQTLPTALVHCAASWPLAAWFVAFPFLRFAVGYFNVLAVQYTFLKYRGYSRVYGFSPTLSIYVIK